MIRFDRSILRTAATAGLVLALAAGLSACGRKGPLDPPPGASSLSPNAQDLEYDPQGRPLAPKGEKKRLPIDWLLD